MLLEPANAVDIFKEKLTLYCCVECYWAAIQRSKLKRLVNILAEKCLGLLAVMKTFEQQSGRGETDKRAGLERQPLRNNIAAG